MQANANFDLGPELPQQHVNLEVDRARQRQYGRWMLMGLVLLSALLFNAWQKSQADADRLREMALQDARAQEEARGRLLDAALLSLRSPQRIEELAVNQLHLVLPGAGDTVVLERAVASSPPPASVVALRH